MKVQLKYIKEIRNVKWIAGENDVTLDAEESKKVTTENGTKQIDHWNLRAEVFTNSSYQSSDTAYNESTWIMGFDSRKHTKWKWKFDNSYTYASQSGLTSEQARLSAISEWNKTMTEYFT